MEHCEDIDKSYKLIDHPLPDQSTKTTNQVNGWMGTWIEQKLMVLQWLWEKELHFQLKRTVSHVIPRHKGH